ncbi:LutC/YkgG family protein [Confluentibacter lentus]|uniref:LutC/YkgG family protein n=1 Tax=Confluentibacter lentus TaxID=1699412 RepID=UPI000C290AD3|nr:LUD domain-containing protein [Confluentibacter lentus]
MSRESILSAIKKNKPEQVSLPEIDLGIFHEDVDLVETFSKNLESVGGRIVSFNRIEDLDAEIKKRYPNAKHIVSCSSESNLATMSISNETEPHSLECIDLVIIDAQVGVSENGAVWISDNDFIVRVLPFITNDLVLILSKKDICLHMHEAYNIISKRYRTFGLFLSGPSKTADIEQCLVIGAQGAVSLTVFLI